MERNTKVVVLTGPTNSGKTITLKKLREHLMQCEGYVCLSHKEFGGRDNHADFFDFLQNKADMSLSFPVMNGTILRRIGVKNDASTPARNIPRSIPFADDVRNDTAIIAAMQISKIRLPRYPYNP